MYDIHCHVLFDVDDGAKDIEDSMSICALAAASGVKGICATPHYIDGDGEIEVSLINERIGTLNNEIKSRGIDMQIIPGMEVFITSNLVELYKNGRILGLNNTVYLLIELPLYNNLPNYLYEMLFSLEIKGIKPIIAHPERCRAIIDHPNTVFRLIERGCFIQINAGSITNTSDRKVIQTAENLLKHKLVHAVASDTHSCSGRIHSLSIAYNTVLKDYGKSFADELFITNPQRIINGQDLVITEPERIEKRRLGLFYGD